MKNSIVLAFTCSENYFGLLYSAISSIVKNRDRKDFFKIYLVVSSLDKEKVKKLYSLDKEHLELCLIEVKEVHLEAIKTFPLYYHFTVEAYFRLLFSSLLAQEEKILYLDPDIIVKTSLFPLYQTDISDYAIGAVPEVFGLDNSLRVHGDPKITYFNSGVMLLNLKKWRNNALEEKILKIGHARKNDLKFVDQDILNIYFKDNYFMLGKEWNSPAYLDDDNAKIIHFCGTDKMNFPQSVLLKEYGYREKFRWRGIKHYVKKILAAFFSKKYARILFKKYVYPSVAYCSDIIQKDEKAKNKKEQELIEREFPNLIVKNGPFKGMRYAKGHSVCSALLPKLVGCYESELHQIIEDVICTNPQTIIDIGCAEGYYAVGLAMRCPQSNVFAYDIDMSAKNLCYATAVKNNIQDRIFIGSECKNADLIMFSKMSGVIVCDCEGYEISLFDRKTVDELKNFYFIIELHDCFNVGISQTLKEIFSESHDIRIVHGLRDTDKAYLYNMPPLQKYSLKERYSIVSERRLEPMDWLYCSPRTGS